MPPGRRQQPDDHDPEQASTDLPRGLSAPARRALASAGIIRLEHLSTRTESELRKLHGMGPKAIRQLEEALAERGLGFRREAV